MPAKGVYKPNRQGFHEIANSPKIKAALRAVAEKGKQHAEGLARDFEKTGDYARSFKVTEGTIVLKGKAQDLVDGARATAKLSNTSGHSVAVEYGNRGRKAHHTINRTRDFLVAEGGAG